MNDLAREEWIINDEGLYKWQRGSRMPMSVFIRKHRQEIDKAIVRQGGVL